jgi:hypothetical protein
MQPFMRCLLIVLLFISCNNFSKNGKLIAQNYKAATRDTIKIMSYDVTAKPIIFETAFFQGTVVKEDSTSIKFYALNIGKIQVQNGSLIASEPWWMYGKQPFITKFPIGQFPVQLAIAKANQNEFVAFSRILFSDDPVDHWEFALKEGQTQMSIFGDSIYLYSVDSGIGGFVDDSSYNNFQALDKASQSQVMDTLTKELDNNKNLYANINCKNVNIVAFSSGLGDGRYATYIGFDKDGNPCRLLTDFDLIDWRKK